MGEFIRDGGAGMYPVLVLGLSSIVLAIASLVRPARRTLALVACAMTLTVLSGCVGATQGIRRGGLAVVDLHDYANVISASLNCLVAALMLATSAMLVTTLAVYRFAARLDEE